MQRLKKLISSSLSFVVLVVMLSILLPGKLHVERSTVINAPPGIAYEQVNNLRNWEKWSPWQQADPKIKLVYSGPEAGNGAQYTWRSSRRVIGDGRLVIADAQLNQRVVTEMYFMKKGKGVVTYTFEETPEGTLVTWTLDSELGANPVNKVKGLIWGSFIGPDFERGLSNLKIVAENQAKALGNSKRSSRF